MNKYAKYIKEIRNHEMYEDERGFVIYGLFQDHCFIEDMYIEPEHRGKNLSKFYADVAANAAKKKGIKTLTCGLNISDSNLEQKLKVFYSYGFKIESAHENYITFIKEI